MDLSGLFALLQGVSQAVCVVARKKQVGVVTASASTGGLR
jgi:hypothetical protein